MNSRIRAGLRKSTIAQSRTIGYDNEASQVNTLTDVRLTCKLPDSGGREHSNVRDEHMKSPKEFDHCADRLKALADRERLRIIQCLFSGPHNVGEVAHALREDIVKVSHHLGVLREAGLVSATKHGRFVVYEIPADVAARNRQHAPAGNVIDLGCCRLDLSE